jgi:PAS domain S-box-containing protein
MNSSRHRRTRGAGGKGNYDGVQRLAAFYRALSEMGHTIVHVTKPAALFDELCRIVVRDCGACMAWIGLIQNGAVVPMAWAGGAERYTDGLRLACPQPIDADDDLPPTASALRSGRPYISNDFHADPRTAPFRERAARFGIKASGAFPILRAGQVIGTLNLYFDTVGAFVPKLVELIEQLVVDLCFALEHIDREAARIHAERAAHDRELQFAGIVKTAMDAIISVDSQLNIVLFNEAAVRMFGVSASEAIGSPLDRFLPPEIRQTHAQHMRRFAAHGQSARGMGVARELAGLRANGERFPLEASISCAGEGDRLLMTVMARDTTRLRQAEKAHLASIAAEAANRAKTEFLSRISHEVRTPLNAMLGFTQLVLSEAPEGGLNDRQREQLGLVLQAGSHLCQLVEEMLDISRIEAGGMHMAQQDFELLELLRAAVSMSEPQAREHQVTIEQGFLGLDPIPLCSDPARLRQVVLNLLSNAIKYNRPQGHVRLEVQRDRHFVHVVVRDNGLGMSEEQKAQLFQPFNRLGREHSAVQGTGIGLVLVRQLVGLMGGELTVDSRPDEGTTVRVTLPAADEFSAGTPDAPDRNPPREALRGSVLYIEDNPVNMLLVEQIMSRWPQVTLHAAPDGATGLAQARAKLPDLVLLDMQLPDMSGLDLLRQLKADPLTQGITVVGLSANVLADDVASAQAAGAVEYWTKPIDFTTFAEGLARLLKQGGRPVVTPAPGAPQLQ